MSLPHVHCETCPQTPKLFMFLFLTPSFTQCPTASNSPEAVLVKVTNCQIATAQELFSILYFLICDQPVAPFTSPSLLRHSALGLHYPHPFDPPFTALAPSSFLSSSLATHSLQEDAYNPVLNITHILMTPEIISPDLTSVSSIIMFINVYFTSTRCVSNAACPTQHS